MRKLWVDDERNAPDDSWIVARTFQEAINYLIDGVDVVSLDHDLGDFDEDGKELTGYNVAHFLEERAFRVGAEHVPSIYFVHTSNPSGADRIMKCLTAMCNRSAPAISIRRVNILDIEKDPDMFKIL